MRRFLITLLFAALVPVAAFADSAILQFGPASPCLAVGETIRVRMYMQIFPGFSRIPPTPWGVVTSGSRNPDVAAALGSFQYPSTATEVEITGVAPGLAEVFASSASQSRTIAFEVYEPLAFAGPQKVFAQLRAPLKLTVPWHPQTGRLTIWYAGAVNDITHPIGGGTELTFTPQAYGTQHVWARSAGFCSTDVAEFEINVPQLKRRAAR